MQGIVLNLESVLLLWNLLLSFLLQRFLFQVAEADRQKLVRVFDNEGIAQNGAPAMSYLVIGRNVTNLDGRGASPHFGLRDLDAVTDNTAGLDDGVSAQLGALANGGAVAHDVVAVQVTAPEGDVGADLGVVADVELGLDGEAGGDGVGGRERAVDGAGGKRGVVADDAVGADVDEGEVAAHDGAVHDGGLVVDDGRADDGGGRGDKRVGLDKRADRVGVQGHDGAVVGAVARRGGRAQAAQARGAAQRGRQALHAARMDRGAAGALRGGLRGGVAGARPRPCGGRRR